VLSLFDELRAAGRTIVLITHEPDVAAAAGRVVRIRDGQLESPDLALAAGDAV
jgi:putative ABC transport system ATP-binding protein